MDRTLAIFTVLALAIIAVTAGMVITSPPAGEPAGILVPPAPGNPVMPTDPAAQDPTHTLARQFVMDDATFKFDGMVDTLKVSLDGSADPVIAMVEFTSTQAGYGNRSGMMLAQVLTPHRAVLTISGGRVTSAVMDDQWDMLSQKEIMK